MIEIFSFLGKEDVKAEASNSIEDKSDKGIVIDSTEQNKGIKENILKLVLNSNLCLFKKSYNKYRCFFCDSMFTDLIKLRTHSISHTKKEITWKIRVLKLRNLQKVDVADLKCNHCCNSFKKLEEVKTHLTQEHDVTFDVTSRDVLVPYNLVDKDVKCLICNEEFQSINKLVIHMNRHYPNFVCDLCGQGFSTHRSLKGHEKNKHKNSICKVCNEIFSNSSDLTGHRMKVHKVTPKRHCMYCELTFTSPVALQEHKINVHGVEKKEFVCTFCGKGFLIHYLLTAHINATHLKRRKHACDRCSMVFYTKSELSRHLNTTHVDAKNFVCSLCNAKFKMLVAPARLIEEKYEHPTEITKPRMLKENTIKLINNSNIIIFGGTRKFKCLLCRANFACISNLRVHSVTKHRADEIANKILAQRLSSYFQTDITNLKCSQCSLPCETLEELKKHLVKCHDVKLFSIDSMLIPFRFSKDNILRCVICEEVFENFAKLSRHMTAHYGNFVCQTCGTAYYDNNRLQIHIKTNHRAVKCSICNMKFSTTQEKFKHRRNVHKIIEKRHCTCCPATFPNAYKLLRHMIEEHGKQKPELTCPFCDQKFILKGARSTHIKTVHQGVRTKSCDICSMKFYRNSDLIRHQTTHDSEKKYLCVICQTKFKSKDSLSRHLKNKLRCKGSNAKLLYSSQDGARIEDLLN